MWRLLVVVLATSLALLTACTRTAEPDDPSVEARPEEETRPDEMVEPENEPEDPPTPAESLCDTLTTEPYEVRKDALDGSDENVRSEAGETCSEAVESLTAARELEERVAALGSEPLTTTFSICDQERMRVRVEAVSAQEYVGVYMAVESRVDNDDESTWRAAPRIAWSLAPAPIGLFEYPVSLAEARDNCHARLSWFLQDEPLSGDGPIDAAIPGDQAETDDPQASDDPATWIPALWGLWHEVREQKDPAGVARYEDLRSKEYGPQVESAVEGPWYSERTLDLVEVCDRQDKGNKAAVTYRYRDEQVVDGESKVEQGTSLAVFRRGSDGRWRWLGNPLELVGDDCPLLDQFWVPGQ